MEGLSFLEKSDAENSKGPGYQGAGHDTLALLNTRLGGQGMETVVGLGSPVSS